MTPLTRHGISSESVPQSRLGTSSMQTRLIKDKRYWLGRLQMHMEEITNEKEALLRSKQNLDREQSARKAISSRVSELKRNLSNYQATLFGMNIALDANKSGLTRQHILNELSALRAHNENLQNKVEKLFTECQAQRKRNQDLSDEINAENQALNEKIYLLSKSEQEKYKVFMLKSENLRQTSTEIHDQINEKLKQKKSIDTTLRQSNLNVEAMELLMKLNESVKKRNEIRAEIAQQLTPAQEHEKLINEVRQNNQALSIIARNTTSQEELLNKKREQLRKIEENLEKFTSDKQAKYKELKRRDEKMTIFINNFTSTLMAERRNVQKLQEQIAYAIEQITVQGINLKSIKLDNLESNKNENDLSSEATLRREYEKLLIKLKQLQILEKRITSQLENFRKDEEKLLTDLKDVENLDTLRTDAAVKMEQNLTLINEFKNQESLIQEVNREYQSQINEIKYQLQENESYRQNFYLESNFMELMKENKVSTQFIEERMKEFNCLELKKQNEEILRKLLKMNDN